MGAEYWEGAYSKEPFFYPSYDGWLDKYRALWENAGNIIDLGCGSGVNSIFLRGQGVRTIACDFSGEALARLKSALPDARRMCFDMSAGLPFDDGFSDLFVADLSLHYFTKTDTVGILRDIGRVLSTRGHLLCRVNAVREFAENEKDESVETEHHVYKNRKGIKRYFNRADVDEFFTGWKVLSTAEVVIHKYAGKKYAWEICAGNTKRVACMDTPYSFLD